MQKGTIMKIYRYPSVAAKKRLDTIVNRCVDFKARDIQVVKRILTDVRKNKDRALIDYVNRFDAPNLPISSLQVTKEEIKAARCQVNKGFIRSLNKAATQIEEFHRHQVEKSWFTADAGGTLLGQLVRPVNAAGIYVPGGKGGETPLVSSVLMGCIPAKIAGVKNICITTPPTRTGEVNPHLLVAAQRAGVEKIYKAGSAWGIAALAYGTETVPKVDVIAGPGNIYVTLAKKMVSGSVGIDMIAGPSEILIIADTTANPAYITADLLSQAEHDPLSSAMLITTSPELARAVSDGLIGKTEELPRKAIVEASLKTYGALMVVPDLATAFELANHIAPEHLELHVEEPLRYLGCIQNAGAVFFGPHTPEAVGDYVAGPNHVLPTAGCARFASALSVNHFIKKTSVLHYTEEALKRDGPDVIRLAGIEGLSAHAMAVKVRVKK